jgi:hypothetical protein
VIASWTVVGVALAAAGAITVAVVTQDDEPARVDISRPIIERGSINAIDHREELRSRVHTPSETVAEHGSINAIEHRDTPPIWIEPRLGPR